MTGTEWTILELQQSGPERLEVIGTHCHIIVWLFIASSLLSRVNRPRLKGKTVKNVISFLADYAKRSKVISID